MKKKNHPLLNTQININSFQFQVPNSQELPFLSIQNRITFFIIHHIVSATKQSTNQTTPNQKIYINLQSEKKKKKKSKKSLTRRKRLRFLEREQRAWVASMASWSSWSLGFWFRRRIQSREREKLKIFFFFLRKEKLKN